MKTVLHIYKLRLDYNNLIRRNDYYVSKYYNKKKKKTSLINVTRHANRSIFVSTFLLDNTFIFCGNIARTQ